MKDGEIMVQEFINGAYKYTIASPVLIVSKVRLNGVDISKYLSNESKVAWYDVSKDSGRDTTTADGTMILNVIGTKWRLDLVSRPLTDDEVVDFYAEIIKKPSPIIVEFLNPFTKQWKTITCYRGDRLAQAMMPYETPTGIIELYNPATQAVIEM